MKEPRIFYGWVIVAAGLVVWTVEPGLYTSFGVFLKPISAELSWTRGTTSLALSLSTAMIGILAPFAGALSDRYGPRQLVMASGILIGLGYALLFTVHSLWQFYLAYFLVGSGMGITFAPIVATVTRWFETKRGQAIGITGVGTGIGGIFFPILCNYLIIAWGWRSTYLFLGILMGTLVFFSGMLLRRDPAQMGLKPYGAERAAARASASGGQTANAAGVSFSLRDALSTYAFWIIFLAAGAAIFSFILTQVHLVPYATDVGISAGMAATMMSVLAVTNSAGRLGLGALSDRIGRKGTMVLSLAVQGLALLLLIGARSPLTFYLYGALFGLGYGGFFVTYFAIAGELFGMAAIGAIVGAFQAGSNLVGAGGPFAAGAIFDATGSYTMVFILGGVMLLATSAGMAFLRRPVKELQPTLPEVVPAP